MRAIRFPDRRMGPATPGRHGIGRAPGITGSVGGIRVWPRCGDSVAFAGLIPVRGINDNCSYATQQQLAAT
jgi:hypothetical protein